MVIFMGHNFREILKRAPEFNLRGFIFVTQICCTIDILWVYNLCMKLDPENNEI